MLVYRFSILRAILIVSIAVIGAGFAVAVVPLPYSFLVLLPLVLAVSSVIVFRKNRRVEVDEYGIRDFDALGRIGVVATWEELEELEFSGGGDGLDRVSIRTIHGAINILHLERTRDLLNQIRARRPDLARSEHPL